MREIYKIIYQWFLTVFAGMFLWLFIYDFIFPFLLDVIDSNRPLREWSMPVCAGLVIFIGYLYGKFFIQSRLKFYVLFLVYAFTVSVSVVSDTQCGGLSCDTGSPTYLILLYSIPFVMVPLSLIYTLVSFKEFTARQKYAVITGWALFLIVFIWFILRFVI